MVSSEKMERVVIEETLGLPPPETESEEAREMRLRLREEIAEIKAKGGIVEIPPSGL